MCNVSVEFQMVKISRCRLSSPKHTEFSHLKFFQRTAKKFTKVYSARKLRSIVLYRVVRKPVNVDAGFKVYRSIHFSSIKVFVIAYVSVHFVTFQTQT